MALTPYYINISYRLELNTSPLLGHTMSNSNVNTLYVLTIYLSENADWINSESHHHKHQKLGLPGMTCSGCPTCLPARYIVNHLEAQDEGDDILLDILNAPDDDDGLYIDCNDSSDFAKLAQCLIYAETANAALTEPIDDPNEKDPKTVHEAESSTYWTYWLAAIYEELESLKAKGVYEEVNELPAG